jgi:prepilin-type processing-associated H-X9-DG protein
MPSTLLPVPDAEAASGAHLKVIDGTTGSPVEPGGGAGRDVLVGGSGHDDRDPASTSGSRHTGGVNAAFGDGSVRFISDSITLRAVEVANDGTDNSHGTHVAGTIGATVHGHVPASAGTTDLAAPDDVTEAGTQIPIKVKHNL